MRISWKKFLVATLVIAVAVLLNGAHFSWKGFQPLNVPKAYAGNITTAGWNLSSDTLSATGVTYTHTFTTATAMTGGGTITIELRTPPGPSVPLPDFSASTTGAGSTTGLSGLTPSIYWSGSAVSLTLTTSTTIPAGSVTVAFTNVTNPSQGAVLQTNTSTASTNGTALDGTKFSATPNGTLVIGPVVLSGQITDSSTGNPVAGVPLQIHTMNGNGAFQQTYTDSHGNYQFVGVPAGADYVLEMRIDQLDPNNTNTATVSQYVAFNPVNVTIT
ncbi:carboxypeptidase regulatory-like domain-containing protein, partial [Patescibacteria group bacterium]|nr:carboxypeptidase regulatory-like domain-containing protein [Patescibacteria group bacterium]